ncbi:MAG TPA: hypothetical protein VGH42_12640 [Verrucomicrobiae bacterium]
MPARAGGFFIQNPKHTPHPHQLIPATNQIVQEFADLLAVIATAAADNQITPAEAEQIRARWEELKTYPCLMCHPNTVHHFEARPMSG